VACYAWWGLTDPDQKRWAPGFAASGLIALATGLHMSLTWPLDYQGGIFNIAYGETSALFGAILLGTALALWMNWGLLSIGIYSLFAAALAVVVGVRIIHLGLTAQPLLAGAGFILTGLAGAFALPVLANRDRRFLRAAGAIVLLVAVMIWVMTVYVAYWNHLIPS